MLYEIAHLLRNRCSFLWEWMEGLNAFLFTIRYHKRLTRVPNVLEKASTDKLVMTIGDVSDATDLASFFAQQPESAFEFFKPHDFDVRTLKKLLGRSSFMIFLVKKEGIIVGYFFLRSFVHGQSYLGKMVDEKHQGQGIGKLMCLSAMHIAQHVGLKMFESISKKNIASFRSSATVLKQVVIEELEGEDLLMEDLPLDK